jgi:hypothetical protein
MSDDLGNLANIFGHMGQQSRQSAIRAEAQKHNQLLEEQLKLQHATERERLESDRERLKLEQERLNLEQQDRDAQKLNLEKLKDLRKMMAGFSRELDELTAEHS